jgi:antitoxin (DNA-binding transcriptional repressor) of toxin-antitoxin stability system
LTTKRIARSGKPVVRLSRLDPPTGTIVFGVLQGRVEVADDFDAPLPEVVLAAFEGIE